ncbi:MAG: polysaccharide biosynthesis protein [Bacteroidota bacterium]
MRQQLSLRSALQRVATPPLDALLIAAALALAFNIRFEGAIPAQYLALLPRVLGYWLLARFLWLAVFRFYDQAWEYASIREVLVILWAITAGTVTLYGVNWLLPWDGLQSRVPRSIFVIEWLLAGFFLGGYRLLIRIRHDGARKKAPQPGAALPETCTPKRLLIVGAGDAGAICLREIRRAKSWDVVGFIDDDPKKAGTFVAGVPVLGDRSRLAEIVAERGAHEILIAMPSVSRSTVREIVALARKTGCPVRTLPGLYDLIDGRVTVNQIREVQIEDLLGRQPVETDTRQIGAYLKDQSVLVTGAGGSIGSELCRQIARFSPRVLILLGHGENSIFNIERQLRLIHPDLHVVSVIGDIRDRGKLDRLFAAHRPAVVFHAAAHKHVPLMEENPDEAVTNNVLGTRNLVEASLAYHARSFVLISTDKAVNPANVMGSTKRVAEMVIQAANGRGTTRFMAVRFGNVLGSRGSVIPVFREQIARGGPVTVTHPEMTRYFMTIPEAVQLVLQAAALGEGGEVFLLNMGEPVRIVDLACDMIRLSGFEPGVDIQIIFTGIRPGEKLYEELLTEGENVSSTVHPNIMKLRLPQLDSERLERQIEQLAGAAAAGDVEQTLKLLRYLVADQEMMHETLRQTAASEDSSSLKQPAGGNA